MELKDKLQFLRKQNGYSQEQLADKLGIARKPLASGTMVWRYRN